MNNTQSDKDERAALVAEIESELDPQAICQEFMLDHAQWQMILSALRAVPELRTLMPGMTPRTDAITDDPSYWGDYRDLARQLEREIGYWKEVAISSANAANFAAPVSAIQPDPEEMGEQQKRAWLAVAELLNEICPDWHTATKGSGTQKALAAIRALASRSTTQRREERRIYKDAENYPAYLKARFSDTTRISFEWEGKRWQYKYTDFDHTGDFDLLLGEALSATQERKV